MPERRPLTPGECIKIANATRCEHAAARARERADEYEAKAERLRSEVAEAVTS